MMMMTWTRRSLLRRRSRAAATGWRGRGRRRHATNLRLVAGRMVDKGWGLYWGRV